MIGEKIGEFQGKVTGRRVLPNDGSSPRVETSFEIRGLMSGVESEIWGTYWSAVRPDGTLYGECPQQGILMTKDGEIGTWTGAGVGHFTGKGSAVSFRGAIYFDTKSERFSHLKSIAVAYEWDVDENGNAQCVCFEWK